MLIDHSCFLNCLILSCLYYFCLLITMLQKLFIHTWYKPFARYLYYKNRHPVCGLLIHFLKFFLRVNVLNFDKVQFIILLVLLFMFLKTTAYSLLQKYSHIFIISAFTFRSVIYLKLWCEIGVKGLFLFQMDIQLPQKHWLKNYPFSHWINLSLWKSIDCIHVDLFLNPQFCCIWSICPHIHCLGCYYFILILEIRLINFSNFYLLYQ